MYFQILYLFLSIKLTFNSNSKFMFYFQILGPPIYIQIHNLVLFINF